MKNISKTAALYCRLSVEDRFKTGESESIQNQRSILLEYAEAHGFNVYKIYCDEDYSGLDDERPAFVSMLEAARQGLFSAIICKSQSRFSRSIETAEKYLHREFPIWGIRFISIIDNVDTAYSSGKRARQINSLVNEWYCEELSQSIRAVFRQKMEQGLFIGSFAPYGYIKSSEDRHRLEPDPIAAETVREIFRLCTECGLSCPDIAKKLTARGAPTPSMYKKSKGIDKNHNPQSGLSKNKGVWHPNTIRKILKNPVYMGTLAQGREKRISYKCKKQLPVPQEKWCVVPNAHKALVEEAIYNKAQKILSEKGRRIKAEAGSV